MSLFDLVCVGADKPSWYKDDRPFRSLNATTGKVRWVPVEALLPGHVYYGGSFAELNRLTGGTFQGQHVLYLVRGSCRDAQASALLCGNAA